MKYKVHIIQSHPYMKGETLTKRAFEIKENAIEFARKELMGKKGCFADIKKGNACCMCFYSRGNFEEYHSSNF